MLTAEQLRNIQQCVFNQNISKSKRTEFLSRHQIAVYVMVGGGMLGSSAALRPASFYIDTRVSRLPYSKRKIMDAVHSLAQLARALNYNPDDLPPLPFVHHMHAF